MMMRGLCLKLVAALLFVQPLQLFAKEGDVIVSVNKPGAAIEPTMWGVFFEDINLGADGGIYAELVKNRSFEFNKPFMGWKVDQQPFKEGAVTVLNRQGN